MIKKHYKLIIFLLIIFTIFLIYKDNHINYFNYTSLGDGYALGINSYGVEEYGYSDFIQERLRENNKLKLYTKSFAEKDQSINRLYESIVTNEKKIIDNTERNIRQILRESDLVTLTIGLNDIIYQISITGNINEYQLNKIINQTEEDLTRLIKEIKQYYPKALYVIGYPQMPIENSYIKEGVKRLNQIYKKMDNIIYIDTTNIIGYEDFLQPTCLYPGKKGYYKISEEVIKKLAKDKNNWYTNNASLITMTEKKSWRKER